MYKLLVINTFLNLTLFTFAIFSFAYGRNLIFSQQKTRHIC